MVLANYDKNDSLSLLIAKDSQFGYTDHAGIPARDSLLSIRESEAKNPCMNLDIYALIMLGKQDGLGLRCKGQVYEQESNLKVKLREEFQSIKPTKIITLGSERDAGYQDHRLVTNLTTIFLL
ncbi:MAG: LmbE family N-acetylglucosaminyl deacetylase [Psychromonas sp.]|jgi:LmbE family N-acetylglucosaminyl deacetylase